MSQNLLRADSPNGVPGMTSRAVPTTASSPANTNAPFFGLKKIIATATIMTIALMNHMRVVRRVSREASTEALVGPLGAGVAPSPEGWSGPPLSGSGVVEVFSKGSLFLVSSGHLLFFALLAGVTGSKPKDEITVSGMEIHAAASVNQPVRDKSPISSIIIIGTGLAGLRTTSALRDQGFTGKITILGTEPHLPYDRPPLSKKLLAHSEPVFLHDDLGLILHDLTSHVYSGWTITGLEITEDTDGQPQATVTATSPDAAPKKFTADAVVLAVGSAPIVPSGWAGTHKLYTWEDAQRLRSALIKSEQQEVVIIGAGWIGAELATVAADAGHQVTVVEAQDTPLAAQLGTQIGTITASWYADKGINLLSATSVSTLR